MLSVNYSNEYLLVEFKRPSHSLKHIDYQQVTGYRNDFVPFTSSEIKVLLIGGKRSSDLPPSFNNEPNTSIIFLMKLFQIQETK